MYVENVILCRGQQSGCADLGESQRDGVVEVCDGRRYRNQYAQGNLKNFCSNNFHLRS